MRYKGELPGKSNTFNWGMSIAALYYSAVYVELKTAGKLDLVVNNIDAPAFIYENVQSKDDAHHYLQIKLEGESPNRRGIGSKLILTAGGQKQYLYHSPYRGYMSTMDDREHFGLGRATRVDSLEVTWPDGRYQLLTGLDVDRMVALRQGDASKTGATSPTSPNLPNLPNRLQLFQPVSAIKYKHQASSFVDYDVHPCLPYLATSQ